MFRENRAEPKSVLRLFDVRPTQSMLEVGRTALRKAARVYYFDRKTGKARDISDLDPGSSQAEEAGWGGLTEFSGRVADEVARVVASRG
jgi:hypothetical protein